MRIVRVPNVDGVFQLLCPNRTEPIFPNPTCKANSPVFNITLNMAQLLFPSEIVGLKLIRASQFSQSKPGDNSVMDLLARGLADISMPVMTITPDRADALPHLPALGLGGPCLVYKDPAFVKDSQLADPFSLFSFNIIAPMVFALILMALCQTLKSKIGVVRRKLKISNEMLGFWGISATFVLGIYLGIFQTDIILKFNIVPTPHDPFQDFPEGLLRELESRRYTAVTVSEVYLETLLSPALNGEHAPTLSEKRFQRAARRNPPKVVSLKEQVRLLRSKTRRYVSLADRMVVDFLRREVCGLRVKEFFGNEILTAFYRPGLEREMTLDYGKIEMINILAEHESKRFIDSGTKCHRPPPPKQLKMSQVQGVFWLLLLCAVVGFSVLFTELLSFSLPRALKLEWPVLKV